MREECLLLRHEHWFYSVTYMASFGNWGLHCPWCSILLYNRELQEVMIVIFICHSINMAKEMAIACMFTNIYVYVYNFIYTFFIKIRVSWWVCSPLKVGTKNGTTFILWVTSNRGQRGDCACTAMFNDRLIELCYWPDGNVSGLTRVMSTDGCEACDRQPGGWRHTTVNHCHRLHGEVTLGKMSCHLGYWNKKSSVAWEHGIVCIMCLMRCGECFVVIVCCLLWYRRILF